MSTIDIFLLDNSNNTKDEVNMIKPKTYLELLKQLRQKIKNIPEYYEVFIIGKNNEEIKINNEEKYKMIEDILFIREIDKSILEQSLFSMNYNKLSESQQEKLDEKYSCILCSLIIKNERPYLCYICQKIFHEKCLSDWDKKCKTEKKNLFCPNCRNELPKEKWKKKLDYEENRKDNANLMNKINEFQINNNMHTNITIIKDKKINELKDNKIKQYELINKYEKYIRKTIQIFRNILNKINSMHSLLNLPNNNILNNLVNSYPLNIQNLDVDDISNAINEELDQFKISIKNVIDNTKYINDFGQLNEKIKIPVSNLKIPNRKFIRKYDDNFYRKNYDLNGDQINLLKIIIDFYKENGYPQVDFGNENQMKELIKSLFSENIDFIEKFDELNYIKSKKKIVKFIYNSNNRILFKIPTFFTNKELYSIAERYKYFHTNFILIHNNTILKKYESSINKISDNDKIFVIENILYPDDSYYNNLKIKYNETEMLNVVVSFEEYEKINFNISQEATIKELIIAITEHRGLTLDNCHFSYNSSKLDPNDLRKTKGIKISNNNIIYIICRLYFPVHDNPPLGKEIFGINKIIGDPIAIGTLDPIKLLFIKVQNQKSIVVKKIIIGKVELKPESDNYLSSYGITNDFRYTFE